MQIEYVIEIPPGIRTNSSITQYVDGVLSQMNNDEAQDAPTPLSHWDELEWGEIQHAAENDVVSFGTKMLPGAGPFYFANHADGKSEIGHIDRDSTDGN